jgi:anti-sigma-K factor RskA
MKLIGKKYSSTLAGEYVLGTLQGRARRNFERELRRNAELRAEVEFWEQKFAPWLLSAAPEKPPRRVWEAVQAELRRETPEKQSFWEKLGFWRPLALASSALALALILYIGYVKQLGVPEGQFYAYLQDPGVEPAFFVRFDKSKGALQVKAVKPPPISADQALELWMLPGEGKSPISLGLLPITGERGIVLPPDKLQILLSSAGLAVSIEPKGGSPTGLPTGPVLYQGSLQAIL